MFWRFRSATNDEVENGTAGDHEAKHPRRLRRWIGVFLTCALVGALGGFLVSYIFPPRYTSQSMILVEGQRIPESYVQPLINGDFSLRLAIIQQQMLSASRLRPVIQSLGLVKPGDEGEMIEDIRTNMTLTPIDWVRASPVSSATPEQGAPSSNDMLMPGFYIGYTNSDPDRAEKICSALTSLMIDENLRWRAGITKGTQDFLSREVEDAGRALSDQDAKLAAFKKRYLGQLPSDIDANMQMLTALNSQLDEITQTLSRARRDKSYAEGILSEEITARNSSQSVSVPQTAADSSVGIVAEQPQVGGGVSTPKAIYQPDPEYSDEARKAKLQGTCVLWLVVGEDGTPRDIRVARRLGLGLDEKAIQAVKNWRFDPGMKDGKPVATPINVEVTFELDEPRGIGKLRSEIQQYQGVIDESTADQKRLQAQINVYQARTAMGPAIEEQYRKITRDYEIEQNSYRDLLTKKLAAQVQIDVENDSLGEQMIMLSPASLPDSAEFPDRPLCAGGGVIAGLLLALGRFLWPARKPIGPEIEHPS